MKTPLIKMLAVGALAAMSAASSAAVIQTFGAGSAVQTVTNAAHFELNTLLANDWAEDGLLFHYVGAGANNGCGYAGIDCYDAPSDLGPSFSGNYMATAGSNSYISVRRQDGADFYRIEFAAGSGYATLNGFWTTWNGGVRTGLGNFSAPAGGVLGLRDALGFDEVRYYAFSTANKQSGWSAPAIDEVRVGVPEPGSLALFAAALGGMLGVRRRRGM